MAAHSEIPGRVMGRAKMLPWQLGEIHATLDDANGRWLARARYRDGSGKSVAIKRQGRTKFGAKQAVRDAVTDAEARWDAVKKDDVLTVAHLAVEWLEVRRPATVVIDPATQAGTTPTAGLKMQSWLQYKQKLNTHVIPVLGNTAVSALTTPMCQSLIHGLYKLEAGTGFRTASITKQVFQQVLDYAIQQGHRTDNPLRSISKIPRKRSKPKAMTPAMVQRVHSAVANRHPESGVGEPRPTSRLADIVTLLSATGMRVGEVLALRWEDVDLLSTPPTVTVSGTLVEGRYFYRQDRRKTGEEDLIYPLTSWACGMLLRRSANAARTLTGAVFATRNGTFYRPSNFRTDLKKALKVGRISEDITPHTFRRTVASELAEALNDQAASIQLGHSSPEVTRRSYIARPKMIPDFSAGLDNLAPKMTPRLMTPTLESADRG